MAQSLDVFDYLDYRRFLRLGIETAKKAGVISGLRDVAGYLGLKSPGHITWILQGKRDLAPRLVATMAKLLSLDTKQSQYFALLVEYNDTSDPDTRRRAFKKLVTLHIQRKKILGQSSTAYWSDWHHAVIREMISMGKFVREDAAKIGQLLIPEVSAYKVSESLKLLQKLGFISSAKNGEFVRDTPVLSTGENWTVESIRAFQLSILELSGRALIEVSKEEREISTITCSMSEDSFRKVKTRLQEMRQEILTIIRTDPTPSAVYHLSMQLFPASKSVDSAHE